MDRLRDKKINKNQRRTVYTNFKIFLECLVIDHLRHQQELNKFCDFFEPRFDRLNIPFFSAYPQDLPLHLKNEVSHYISSILQTQIH